MSDNDNYEDAKRKTHILILGPYGDEGLARLSRLKKFLIQNGYLMSDIVNDKDDPDDLNGQKMSNEKFSYLKSMHYLKLSQINIFVFFKDIPHGSVLIEMVTAISNLGMLCCTTFLIEDGTKLDTLAEGFLESNECTRFTFSGDDELAKKSRSACWNHVVDDECYKYGILKINNTPALPDNSNNSSMEK